MTTDQTLEIIKKCAILLGDSAELGLKYAKHFQDSAVNIEYSTIKKLKNKWKTIKSLEGSNHKNTEPFTIKKKTMEDNLGFYSNRRI